MQGSPVLMIVDRQLQCVPLVIPDAVCQTVWPGEQCATGEIRGLVTLRVGLDQRGTGQRQLSKACSPRINGGVQ